MTTKRRWKRFLRIIIVTAMAYCAIMAVLLLAETSLVYQPFHGAENPQAAGLAHFTRKTLPQPNGDTIVYWENTAHRNATTILYFHGNGGGLHYHTAVLAYLDAARFHVVAMEYPGYPGAAGTPSQEKIGTHAVALFDAIATQRHPKPVIWGFSLGSGIATQLAAKRPAAALVLEAPFTAVDDRASELFPLIPVHALMRNPYRSHEVISKIYRPVFIMHGTADRIIPIHHGRTLFALANSPKIFREYEGYGHLDLIQSNAYTDAVGFIRVHTR